MILGTAGHIDHGKTTLVHALTGVDTDRLPEERKRGITIELGFAPLVVEGIGTVGVVDVPGHEAFVRTMVAGATGMDLALVVIAGDEGVMPQTREHLAILEFLGVRTGVVALTKCDLVDPEWLALVEEDVQSVIGRVLPNAPIVYTSARTGQGITELRQAISNVASSIIPRFVDDVFRLPVDRAFSIKGTGTVVTGTVWSGRLERDEIVRVLPGNHSARVRGIQGHGERMDVAMPGGRAAIALAGIEVADVPRGSTIVTDRDWHPTTFARAEITLAPGAEVDIRPRTWFRLHVGTSEIGARIVTRLASPDGQDGESRSRPARLVFEKPVLLRAGDRFVVRTTAPLNTIAGGVITDPYAPKRASLWPAGLSARDRLDRLVTDAGAAGLDLSSLRIRLGERDAECRRLVAVMGHSVVRLSGRIIARESFEDVARRIADDVTKHHSAFPLDLGVPVQALRSAVKAPPEIADAALAEEVRAGVLANVAGMVSRVGWVPKLTSEQASLADSILTKLAASGAEPPSVEELASELGASTAELLRYLERRGELIQVEQTRYYASAQVRLLVGRLKDAMAGGQELSPTELKETFGLSRKYLIPFLEYCDRVGHTARTSGGRVWRGT